MYLSNFDSFKRKDEHVDGNDETDKKRLNRLF